MCVKLWDILKEGKKEEGKKEEVEVSSFCSMEYVALCLNELKNISARKATQVTWYKLTNLYRKKHQINVD